MNQNLAIAGGSPAIDRELQPFKSMGSDEEEAAARSRIEQLYERITAPVPVRREA